MSQVEYEEYKREEQQQMENLKNVKFSNLFEKKTDKIWFLVAGVSQSLLINKKKNLLLCCCLVVFEPFIELVSAFILFFISPECFSSF